MDTTMIPIDDIRAKQAKGVNEAYELFGIDATGAVSDQAVNAAYWQYASKSNEQKCRARKALSMIAQERRSPLLHSTVKNSQHFSEEIVEIVKFINAAPPAKYEELLKIEKILHNPFQVKHMKRDVKNDSNRDEDSMAFDEKDNVWRCVHCHWEIVTDDKNIGRCHCEELLLSELDTKDININDKVREVIGRMYQKDPQISAMIFAAALLAAGHDITPIVHRLQAKGALVEWKPERLHDLGLVPAYEKAYDSSDDSSSDDTESEGDSEDQRFIDDRPILEVSDVDITSALSLPGPQFPELLNKRYKVMTDNVGNFFYELLHGESSDGPLELDDDPMLTPAEHFGAGEKEERKY